MSDYLHQRLGITTTVATPPPLDPQEKDIENSIGELLQIIDMHLAWWRTTSSTRTVDALIASKACTSGLLAALYSRENRLEHLCAAIYGRDIPSLVRAIRAPVVRDAAQAAGQQLRDRAVDDRRKLKNLLKDIVVNLRSMCSRQIDQVNFERIMHAPRETIQAWCDLAVAQVDQVDERADLDNEDNLAVAVV